MDQEKFCLKWNDFHSTVSGSFGQLRKEEDFFDVTLVSDDENQLPAHKLVLSACSSFFKTILKKNTHSHPLIYLSGVNSANLGFILDYIYQGEVQVSQDDLDNFLDVAEKLKIEGLISDNRFQGEGIKEEEDNCFSDDTLDSNVQSSTVPKQFVKSEAKIYLSNVPNIEAVDQKIEELTDRINGVWTCKACGKISQRKRDLGWHIETHMEGLSFACTECDKTFRSRAALFNHKRKVCNVKNSL